MPSVSCIYEGTITHRRLRPLKHEFQLRLFMVYLDLSELPQALDGQPGCSARRPAPAWFRRKDYLGPPELDLAEAVRRQVEQHLGTRPNGPIRMLTHLRTFGYVFNPVTFYYVFDEAGQRLESVVAEITNTPWGQRHVYVLRHEAGAAAFLDKRFHVSPFLPMDMQYRWTFSLPDDHLGVHMENWREGERVFDATLAMHRRPLRPGALTRHLLRFPLMTLQVIVAIHFQAFRLWRKRVPFFSHPAKAARSST